MRDVNTKHPQISIIGNGKAVSIDEQLVPLIRMMWDLGITTNFSCQGDTHLFVNQDCHQAERYRAYIQMHRDTWSLNFIRELFSENTHFVAQMASWDIEFSTNPQTGENRITVRFPSCDIEALVEELGRWN